ncbi:MAG: alpha-glucan family phosphorylase [Candidatus Nitricoxidivorans perseverans]|uniref:Alpha-glucan family phosphorylase n=1 Tax=Candidatus Nitricoxidivorans perseverans TaxID=2975601 RepID=A0AA49IRC9_9PROT|nr:MAG: alpha-glucan family phosphorylase [Candidatus Nitricoxidivorans perseverans]
MSGTRYQLEVNPKLPPRLARLDDLANNLWYSWDRPTRTLFARLGQKLWGAVGHSPKAFLKRIDQHRLDEAAEDPVFLGALARVLSAYDTYHTSPSREHGTHMAEGDLIAYFCAEFGFHESLPIYSGGLGILAGDHCKTASDMNLPFVGVGLLYRQGYFLQSIDAHGHQAAVYNDADFDDLPISPVVGPDGSELFVSVHMPGREVRVKVWQTRVGHITLYLLDTDLEENSHHDRDIAHQLYGGDRTMRIEQEIVLGMGGVRALSALGLKPTVWHINEGHAAFLILERMRQLVIEGVDFGGALEAVASNTVFTTHTAVPAGHDHFALDMIRHYFESCCRDMGCDISALIELGRTPDQPDFNMTALAIRGSRHQNGVSRIHGEVSSRICANLWSQIDAEENPIGFVTNGVHVPTFLSDLWHETFDRLLGPGWIQRLTDAQCWQGIHAIPDHLFWSVRQSMKAQMLHLVRHRIGQQHARNHGSQAHLDRLLRLADPENPNVLTIGFARRFATYKRATLLFQNLSWLKQIIGDAKRPVVFIFAGKAHPADKPGQAMIQRIAEVAAMPEFEGHILMVEGYDLRLARRLVSGVDIWLNNPVYPLEASGTSGMKAAINGVLNLSVLDGWWGEGYQGEQGGNGWAIKPTSSAYDSGVDEGRRDYEEARSLYETLQDKVAPIYYDRGPMGYSPGWVAMSKRSIATVTPRFTSMRMVGEYVTRFYQPAARQWAHYRADNFAAARSLAAWKARVRAAWQGVAIRRVDDQRRRIPYGEGVRFEVALRLNGLRFDDVQLELLFGRPNAVPASRSRRFHLKYQGLHVEGGEEHLFAIDLVPEVCGKIEYRIRAYPHHELLTHPFEMGMMLWL